jgi:hypothetical protein
MGQNKYLELDKLDREERLLKNFKITIERPEGYSYIKSTEIKWNSDFNIENFDRDRCIFCGCDNVGIQEEFVSHTSEYPEENRDSIVYDCQCNSCGKKAGYEDFFGEFGYFHGDDLCGWYHRI